MKTWSKQGKHAVTIVHYEVSVKYISVELEYQGEAYFVCAYGPDVAAWEKALTEASTYPQMRLESGLWDNGRQMRISFHATTGTPWTNKRPHEVKIVGEGKFLGTAMHYDIEYQGDLYTFQVPYPFQQDADPHTVPTFPYVTLSYGADSYTCVSVCVERASGLPGGEYDVELLTHYATAHAYMVLIRYDGLTYLYGVPNAYGGDLLAQLDKLQKQGRSRISVDHFTSDGFPFTSVQFGPVPA